MRALDIADYILSKTPMTNVRLQAMLCLIQEKHLETCGCKAFEDDIFVFPHGPVVLNVYTVMSPYGAVTIPYNGEVVELDAGLREIVDGVVEQYKDMYLWDLVEKTKEMYHHAISITPDGR